MLALAAPHAMAETITHMVTADTDFAKVVKNINASGVDDENVIELCADITLTGNHTLKRSTTIKSKDEDRKISINGSNAGITVTGERTVLNLGAKGYDKKLTIEGDTRVAFITVSEEATANMYENVTLQNRKSTGNACIVIMGSKSVFNMRGGVTENCSRQSPAFPPAAEPVPSTHRRRQAAGGCLRGVYGIARNTPAGKRDFSAA